jgi:hypothetical protein
MPQTTPGVRHFGASRTPRRRLRLQWPVVRVRPGERVVRLAAGETVLRDGELGHMEDVMIRAVYAGLTGDSGPEGDHRAPMATLRAVTGSRGSGAG